MLIGITGQKGAGKDAFARHFIERGFANVKMADPLKAMLRTLLDLAAIDEATIERMIEGDLKEVPSPVLCGKTPRYAMQTLGTEWRNMLGEDLWLNIWRDRVETSDVPVVCTDIRFAHEAAEIIERGGHMVRVERPGLAGGDGHSSETEMTNLPVDVVILNMGSLQQLRIKAEAYHKEISQ